ncbi:MAG: hypothetical protein KGH65_00265 [Candidatus Micrarchaeota archaeon]|nr:hypothetical protein [Candidatus Micrarchaeota archaeon]
MDKMASFKENEGLNLAVRRAYFDHKFRSEKSFGLGSGVGVVIRSTFESMKGRFR